MQNRGGLQKIAARLFDGRRNETIIAKINSGYQVMRGVVDGTLTLYP
jgi:hypothetical protein